MRTADDIFPQTPRPVGHPGWEIAVAFLLVGLASIGAIVWWIAVGDSAVKRSIGIQLYKNVLPLCFLSGPAGLVLGNIFLRRALSRSIWKRGRIEPAYMPAVGLDDPASDLGVLVSLTLGALIPGAGLVSAVVAGWPQIRIVRVIKGQPAAETIRAAAYNFGPRNPEVVWVITSSLNRRPKLLADVAPNGFNGVGTPNDVALEFMASYRQAIDYAARRRSKPRSR
jgi:hypothetical protein